MDQVIADHLSKSDPILSKLIKQIPLPEIESTQNVFHDLMSCIIEQQIHYRSTKKTFQKMMEKASLDELTLQNFPILEEKGFQNVKLSTQKYETILRIVDFFERNNLDWQGEEDGVVRDKLSGIKGVGVWTVDMILLFTLERKNIFPADDYHLRLIMTKLYKIDMSAKVKAQQKAIAENWNPYGSFGVKYLLAWKDFQKKIRV